MRKIDFAAVMLVWGSLVLLGLATMVGFVLTTLATDSIGIAMIIWSFLFFTPIVVYYTWNYFAEDEDER